MRGAPEEFPSDFSVEFPALDLDIVFIPENKKLQLEYRRCKTIHPN